MYFLEKTQKNCGVTPLSDSAIKHCLSTKLVLRTATFRCIGLRNRVFHIIQLILRTATFRRGVPAAKLRNRAVSLYPTALADSNVPAGCPRCRVPQSSIISLQNSSCGQQCSVASGSAIGRYHFTPPLLRTTFINYVISTERQ